MGIVFVAAVGFGALPGVLALAFHSIGMVAKFFAESIEPVSYTHLSICQSGPAESNGNIMRLICFSKSSL